MSGVGAHQILDKAFEANEAIPQYRFVKLVTANERDVDICDSAGEAMIGVCQVEVSAGDATNGRFVDIRLMGVSVVEAGAAITKGAIVATDAAGKAKTGISTEIALGVALDDAGADTDLIAVLLVQAGHIIA